jgi:transposase-like protein
MLRQCRPPRILITDKLASYGAAKKEITPGIEHRQHKGSAIGQRTRISRRDGENDK